PAALRVWETGASHGGGSPSLAIAGWSQDPVQDLFHPLVLGADSRPRSARIQGPLEQRQDEFLIGGVVAGAGLLRPLPLRTEAEGIVRPPRPLLVDRQGSQLLAHLLEVEGPLLEKP